MYAKEIKLAKKLIKKQPRNGIYLLLDTLVKLNDVKSTAKKQYDEAGHLLASILLNKNFRTLINELLKNISQSAIIFLLNTAVEFGQLQGAILALEEWVPLEKMTCETFNFYLDILDSFMARDKALLHAQTYLKFHPELVIGNLEAPLILKAWQTLKPIDITAVSITEETANIEWLALLFKIIKIAYCESKLLAADAIVKTIEPTITQNSNLQGGKIRNAWSYFIYISKLLPLKEKQPHLAHPILYMVGDSHCLSPAWDTVSLCGNNYDIKPLLVTGCKIWHLREHALFHAKTNFYKAIECIPKGSNVLFLFGEIDCREGIVQTVEKGLYPSASKAIEKLLDIYIKRILEAIKLRSLNHLYVHQIPPVLEVTRSIVTLFNQLLEEKIKTLNHAKISWLDAKLLNESGEFNSQFDLDDTHLHPSYIQKATLLISP